MNKKTALEKTSSKFTNLLDGKVLPSATVSGIIEYYENLLEGKPTVKHKATGNIESNFIEDEIDTMHCWDYSEMWGGL